MPRPGKYREQANESAYPHAYRQGLAPRLFGQSRLSWAIVHPTLIFGPEDILVHNIAWLLRRLPVFAVFGDGRYRVRPVHVDDLAALRAGGGRA